MPLPSYSASTAKTSTSPVVLSPLQKPTRVEWWKHPQPFIFPVAMSAALDADVIPYVARCSFEIGF